ncbi:lipoprotein signal peptidase [Mucilaginibacter sp. BJC16-A38]|uniref:lipoprotein signal peptidase n=1 Tax=Mucilaginibacter phenanthrenivorans TaxID=1234842 RepID=UPI0021584CFE|nr:lipoprotein signal peptidase [Mucilaginibacter phenanthrenivorans]MCR8559438.1 lipoprotein signal peptidase [Mucilaginibacter phenanthrenivorans]
MKAVYLRPFLVAAFIVLIDQVIKTWVRTHMDFNTEIHFMGSHGMLRYTENNGMAFGWELGGKVGKLVLTLFRILAVCGIGYGLVYLIQHKYHRGLIMCVALIFAGALGNIIDSTFYGLLYQHGHLFEGRVVDMFYFPLIKGTYPSWFPVWHGQYFEFFQPIFNLADASISVGVIAILIFQKRYFKHEVPEVSSPNSEMEEV